MGELESLREIAGRCQPKPESNIESQPSSATNECPECGGIGWAVGSTGYVPCKCQIEQRVRARLPKRFWAARMTDLPRQWQDEAMEWFKNPGDGLLLCGDPGRGKTHLAAALVRLLAELRRDVRFVECSEMYSEVSASYGNFDGEKEVYETYVQKEFLFLDDLGSGSLSDHERRVTLRIINGRLNALHPTCITTNWSLQQVAERMDERLASRLQTFRALKLAGKDWRADGR